MVEEWVPSPNFQGGRMGDTPIAIVDHTCEGDYPGCLEWLRNPLSKASAHYLVLKDGRVIQLVKEGDRAYHAGIVNTPDWVHYNGYNPNRYTIGIEHEGYSGEPLTELQYRSTLALHRELIAKYGIPIDNNHIIGHYRINSVDKASCPGPAFPWAALFFDLLGGMGDVLKLGVLINTVDDFWSGVDVAAKHGNCAIFVRPSEDAKTVETLIVVGGGSVRASNEILLSGNDKYDTAAAVKKYLGG